MSMVQEMLKIWTYIYHGVCYKVIYDLPWLIMIIFEIKQLTFVSEIQSLDDLFKIGGIIWFM